MSIDEAISIRSRQLQGERIAPSTLAQAIKTIARRGTRKRDKRRTIANPWALSNGMCEALDGLVRFGSVVDAANDLGISPDTVSMQIQRAKRRIGVEHHLQAAIEWDRFARAQA